MGGQQRYTITDCEPLHPFPELLDDSPAFMSWSARFQGILEPGTPFPHRQIRAADAGTLQSHQSLACARPSQITLLDVNLTRAPKARRARTACHPHEFTVNETSRGLVAIIDGSCSHRLSLSMPSLGDTRGRQPVASAKRRVSVT